MKKSKIWSVVNKKGGIAKTTTVSAIGSICAAYGLRVLIVDLDPQVNSTAIFLGERSERTVTDIFIAEDEDITYDFVNSIIRETEYPNVDIIPGDDNLDEIGDKILLLNAEIDNGNIRLKKRAQMLLTKAFELIEQDYDLILIDNTPYFNLISKNALSASNGVLIPIQSDGFSYVGLTKLLDKIYNIRGELNSQLDILGVFFANVNERTNIFKELRENFQNDLQDKLLKTSIRRDNNVYGSNTAFVPLYNYNSTANATIDYMFMVMELHILDEENHKRLVSDLNSYLKKKGEKK